MGMVKKLSIKSVYGVIDYQKLTQAPEQRLFVGRYGGKAVGLKEGTTTQPDGTKSTWTQLVGEFVGINPDTGEESRANALFLPSVAETSVKMAMLGENGQTRPVSFLFDVFCSYAPQAKGAVKYEFSFEPVVADKASDVIEALKALALPFMSKNGPAGGTLKLEAPKTDTKAAEEAAAKAPKLRK